MKKIRFLCLFCMFLALAGCGGLTDVLPGTIDAGIDVVKAVSLSDEDVKSMAKQVADYSDARNPIADSTSKDGKRLQRLTAKHVNEDARGLNFKVYLVSEVNAFALADGSIRVYSGLMDIMDDEELRFVIGHEIGHVAQGHTKKSMQTAYAASAVRKGVASQGGVAGTIAASELGGLVEKLINAQFSQSEEQEADDYGFQFMKKHGYQTKSAVSALTKLADLGGSHGFLSSHPAPDKRAERMRQLLKEVKEPAEEKVEEGTVETKPKKLSKEDILKLQKKLTELGYNPGPVDGIWGRKTEDVLKKFQQDNGLSVTGKLDEETKEKLGW